MRLAARSLTATDVVNALVEKAALFTNNETHAERVHGPESGKTVRRT